MRVCKIDRHTFYMDPDGRIHEYRAQSRIYDPSTGEDYIEDETGHRMPLEDGLWMGIPGEFAWWFILRWRREVRKAADLLQDIPPNFIIMVV